MAGEAIPNIGAPSMEDVARTHLDKRAGKGDTPFHRAAADHAAGNGIRSAHVAATPMAAGFSMGTTISAGKRKPEDF